MKIELKYVESEAKVDRKCTKSEYKLNPEYSEMSKKWIENEQWQKQSSELGANKLIVR